MGLVIDEVLKELNKVMTQTIESTIKVADKYELDRNSTLNTMVNVLNDAVSMGTFYEYEIKEDN